ncbi:sugar transferase [Specibacter cremeus]|uniref:sugar transferase n=1 Tax=Specibacter cremeus TaxID=1629051 RepID=UPI001F0B8166|nr:sugar transferase [Specibacter cremeus]
MSEIKVVRPFGTSSYGRADAQRPAAGQPADQRPRHASWDDVAARGSARAATPWHRSYARRVRITDTVLMLIAISTAYGLRFGMDDAASLAVSQLSYFWVCVLVFVLWGLDLELCRTREGRLFGVGALEYKRVLQSTLRVFGAVAIVLVVFHIEIVRGFFAVALPLGLVLLPAGRWLCRRWLLRRRTEGKYLSDVVVLGNPADVEYVIDQLRSNLSAGYHVAGAALTTLDAEMEFRPPWYQVPVLSTMADISRVVAVTGADTVVVAGQLPGGPQSIQELGWRLEDMATELVLASSLTNVAGPRVHLRPVEGLPLMHVELPQYSGHKHAVKRAMDVMLASFALVVLAPVFLALALIVRLDSPGPVFFRQERVGRNGESFKMLKFRSMVVDAEERLAALRASNEGAGLLFKMAHDPRITRCGRWMRRFSLDELPQFVNVLLGDMSLVGPRPPLRSEVAGYERPAHRRLLIKPGITGLWQISGRSDLPWDEAVRLDLYYVENWSLAGDFIILWRTVKAVYEPTGAY